MTEINDFLARLVREGLLNAGDLSGCTEGEIDQVRQRQRVQVLPQRYREFLAVAGKRQGGLMQGSDWAFADLLELADDSRDLLAEDGVADDFLAGSFVLLMHQGYAFYYFPSEFIDRDDPPVWLYEESAGSPRQSTDSFTDFLRLAAEGLRKLREIERKEVWTATEDG